MRRSYLYLGLIAALSIGNLGGLPPFDIAGTAHATTLAALPLDEITARADHILVGTVERTESKFVDKAKKIIVTDAYVRCRRAVLGVAVGEIFVVRSLGGVVGEIGQRVYGEASYRPGQDVLLLVAERNGSYFSVGMAQGAMVIERQAGVETVHVDIGAAELVGPTGVATTDGQPLATVLSKIEGYLANRRPPNIPMKTGGK